MLKNLSINLYKLCVSALGGLFAFPLWYFFFYIGFEASMNGEVALKAFMFSAFVGVLAFLPFFVYEKVHLSGRKAKYIIFFTSILISYAIFMMLHVFEMISIVTAVGIPSSLIKQRLLELSVSIFFVWFLWLVAVANMYPKDKIIKANVFHVITIGVTFTTLLYVVHTLFLF
ncbi:MAG: hypothetical protein ACP6IU_13660 [Candidatus Asgardarchaeia archaeon]